MVAVGFNPRVRPAQHMVSVASRRGEVVAADGAWRDRGTKKPGLGDRVFCQLDLAATYSHGSYTTTTIGNAAFYGRVRDGIG